MRFPGLPAIPDMQAGVDKEPPQLYVWCHQCDTVIRAAGLGPGGQLRQKSLSPSNIPRNNDMHDL